MNVLCAYNDKFSVTSDLIKEMNLVMFNVPLLVALVSFVDYRITILFFLLVFPVADIILIETFIVVRAED